MFKSKWWRFIPFLPLLVLLVGVNVFGDAGNTFHNPVDVMVSALLNGYPAYAASGNVSERELRYTYMRDMPDDITSFVIGSSNIMCITSMDVGDEKFINLGVSCARIEDSIAQLGILKAFSKDKNIRRVIIGPIEWWFNRKLFEQEDVYTISSKPLMPFADYMLKVINGEDAELRETHNVVFHAGIWELLKFNPALSISYFQANVSYIMGKDVLDMPRMPRNGIVDSRYKGYYYMPDGSLVYSKNVRDRDENDVIRGVNESMAKEKTSGRYSEPVDAKNWQVFIKLIEYLLSQNITVDIYLNPLPPALWDMLDSKEYPFFTELEEAIHKVAEKYSLRVIGSYNPYNVGVTNADFYDARHIRRGHISKYFNLK